MKTLTLAQHQLQHPNFEDSHNKLFEAQIPASLLMPIFEIVRPPASTPTPPNGCPSPMANSTSTLPSSLVGLINPGLTALNIVNAIG